MRSFNVLETTMTFCENVLLCADRKMCRLRSESQPQNIFEEKTEHSCIFFSFRLDVGVLLADVAVEGAGGDAPLELEVAGHVDAAVLVARLLGHPVAVDDVLAAHPLLRGHRVGLLNA